MILVTSVAASLSIFLLALWYLGSQRAMDVRIRELGDQQRYILEQQAPFTQRSAFPFVRGLLRAFTAFLPTSLIGRARQWLVTAGDQYTISQFLSLVLVTSTALPALYFVVVWITVHGTPSALALAPVVGLAFLGFIVPFMMLRQRARSRQRQIWRAMPNALDLLTTCVEAGLSLDFALQRVAERYKGPLSGEIKRAIREMGLGKTRREALLDMAQRINLPDVLTFVNSLVQAETLGTSVGQVLRVQATQMRMRRRQRAEQIARQASVKMVFPLVLCLMPSLFIVIIGPIAIHATQFLNNK